MLKKKENLFLKFFKSLGRGIVNLVCFLLVHPIIAIIVIATLVVSLGFCTWNYHWFGFNTRKVTLESDATLMEMIDLDQIYGATDKYTGIVSKKNPKDKNEILYYASYEGSITAYVDTKEIDFEVKDKEIIVILPEVKNKYTVDMSSLDYMFKDGDDSETITIETYQLAEKDIVEEASNDSAIKKIAKENLINTIKAIFKPLKDEGYEITIK